MFFHKIACGKIHKSLEISTSTCAYVPERICLFHLSVCERRAHIHTRGYIRTLFLPLVIIPTYSPHVKVYVYRKCTIAGNRRMHTHAPILSFTHTYVFVITSMHKSSRRTHIHIHTPLRIYRVSNHADLRVLQKNIVYF